METTQKNPDRCSRCGAAFRCGAQAGESSCWCADYPVIEPAPGSSCLCPSCLRHIAGLKAPRPVGEEPATWTSLIVAVLAGVAVERLGTMTVFAIFRGIRGEIALDLVSPFLLGNLLFTLDALNSGAFSLLAGYLCARIASGSEYRAAAIAGAISAAAGLSMAPADYPSLISRAISALTLATVLLGAKAGRAANRKPRPAKGRT